MKSQTCLLDLALCMAQGLQVAYLVSEVERLK